jgi:hypothetical protein
MRFTSGKYYLTGLEEVAVGLWLGSKSEGASK